MTNRWAHLCDYERSNTSLLYLEKLKVQETQQKGILYFGMICAMVKSRYIGDGHPTFNDAL